MSRCSFPSWCCCRGHYSIEDLADELQDEIDRIAAESEEKAEKIDQVAIKAKKADIEVVEFRLLWR